METTDASAAFASLGSPVRLSLYRHLMVCGPDGDNAGNLAKQLGLVPSTLSFHLKEMEEADLVISWRVGRSIRYAANMLTMRQLIGFLVEDCCQGSSHLCVDLWPFIADQGGELKVSDEKIFNVLFLCTGNSARSIMAECILNREGQGRFRAYSAGSDPKGEVHPYALDILRNQNYATAGLRSKSWDEFAVPDAPEMDFVFTVCDRAAEEICPVWPGQPMTAHWGVPDPAAVEGKEAEKRAAFAETMRFLNNRISIFVNLPMRSLDRLALQKRLDDIGTRHTEKT